MSTDIQPVEDHHAAIDTYMRETTFTDLVQGSEVYQLRGLTLVAKDDLIGIPHIITRVTYWTPTAIGDFVSLEAVVADDDTMNYAIRRGWVPGVTERSQIPLRANEHIVYNDGSTGIRRQITEMLDSFGMIVIGDKGPAPYTVDKKVYNSRFDLPWSEWDSFEGSRVHGDHVVPSIGTNHAGNALAILVGSGLTVSEYSNEFSDNARTFYLR